jgi:uncharacterized protein
MNRSFEAAVAALILAVGFVGSVAGGPAGDGLALERQEAEKGVDLFQYHLGLAYEQGKEVQQDYAEAVKWYRRAADQGRSNAQRQLGLMYYRGRGVPQDFIRAHMWLNLSAVQGDEVAEEGRETVARRMTPAQIAEAQKLAREWKPISTPR